jgi:hypothetical protein
VRVFTGVGQGFSHGLLSVMQVFFYGLHIDMNSGVDWVVEKHILLMCLSLLLLHTVQTFDVDYHKV